MTFSFFPSLPFLLSSMVVQFDINNAPNPGVDGVGGVLPLLPTTTSGLIAALVPQAGPCGSNLGAGTLTEVFDFGGERGTGRVLTDGVRETEGEDGRLGVDAVGEGGNCSWVFLMIGRAISSCI